MCSSGLVVCAGLADSVTDKGLRALAGAGCGAQLTSLALHSECDCGFRSHVAPTLGAVVAASSCQDEALELSLMNTWLF